MSIQIDSSSEKVHFAAEQVRNFGLLIGDINDRAYVPGFHTKPGLGMIAESKSFAALSEDLNEGLFKILVMGKFKNGKSTFVNAILGKNLLAARATATTAVIAIVEYGEHDDIVQVYSENSKKPELISVDEFNEKFSLTPEDMEIIKDNGFCDRFADISYVVMESPSALFKNGVHLIDSPGLEEANSRNKTTNEFVPKANAIVFTLSAMSLFSAEERAYIVKNFYGKNLRNVFFVINMIDNLHKGELENNVIPTVKSVLRNVFTDENGIFDEELFNKRVFYTNAYGALCARTGEPYTINIGATDIQVNLSIEDTGITKFETALSEFLNSDDRLHATFASTLNVMSNTYMSALFTVNDANAAAEIPLAELEKHLETANETLRDLRAQANAMSHLIEHSGEMISEKIFNSLLLYIQTDIPREFEAEIEKNDTSFGIGSMMRLASSALRANLPGSNKEERQKEQEKLLKPITERIEKYIHDKIDIWESRVMAEIEQDVRDLENDLGEKMHKFEIGLDQAMDIFLHGGVTKTDTYVARPLQTVFALSHGNLHLAVEGAATGGMNWGEFFTKTIMHTITEWCIMQIFGSAILLPAVLVQLIGLALSSHQLPATLLKQIGPIAFDKLKERVIEQKLPLEENVILQFKEQSSDLSRNAMDLIDEAEHKQQSILEEKRASEESYNKEAERRSDVLDALRKCFSNVYQTLYNTLPDENTIKNFSERKEACKV